MHVNILEYLKLLVKYRRLLISNLVIVLAVSVVLAVIWPKKYKAVARFIPSFNVQTPFSELRAVDAPDLYKFFAGGLLISDIYVGIMKSRTVMEDVVKKTGLQRVFRHELMEDAIKELEKKSSVEITEEQVITLTIYMPEPDLAARVANTWVNSLDSLNQRVIKQQGSREVTFIRSRLDNVEHKLDSLRDSLAAFERKYRIFALDDELRATVDVYAKLAGQLLQKEVELSKWPKSGGDMPIRRSITAEIKNIRKKLAELESSWRDGIVTKVPLSELPSLQFQHGNLLRSKRILDSLSGYLLLEYEIAELKSVADRPTIVVIDEAIPPEERVWPARAKLVLLSFFFALCFNMVLVLALENVKLKWKL